jgi:hypothetical protein
MLSKMVLLAGLTAFTAAPAMALNWVSYSDLYGAKEYAVTDLSYTWHQAEAFAQSQGGHLVAINDQAENDWLVSTFGGNELLWIGLTDQDLEGSFLWTNGDPFVYDNWNGGEPNDATQEEWAHINWGGPGGWNDWESGADYANAAQGNMSFQNDSFPIRAVIERQVVPEPGTWLGAVGVIGIVGLAMRRRLRS